MAYKTSPNCQLALVFAGGGRVEVVLENKRLNVIRRGECERLLGVHLPQENGEPPWQCPVEEAFWVGPENLISPIPANSKKTEDWSVEAFLSGKVNYERLAVWCRIPSFLMSDNEGHHHAWLVIVLHLNVVRRQVHRHVIVQAGKELKRIPPANIGGIFTVDAFIQRWSYEAKLGEGVSVQVSGGAQLSAAERILNIQTRAELPMLASWDLEPASANDDTPVRVLTLRRMFERTTTAADPMFQLDEKESRMAPSSDELARRRSFILAQRGRPLETLLEQHPGGKGPRYPSGWCLQPSVRWDEPIKNPAFANPWPLALQVLPYCDLLGEMLGRWWDDTSRAENPRLSNALFGLVPKQLGQLISKSGEKKWSRDVFNPLPEHDLVTNDKFFRSGHPGTEPGAGAFRLEARPPEFWHRLLRENAGVRDYSAALDWKYLRNHRGEGHPNLAKVVVTGPPDSEFTPVEAGGTAQYRSTRSWLLRWQVQIVKDESGLVGKKQSPLRIGALDLVPANGVPDGRENKKSSCVFYFQLMDDTHGRWDTVEQARMTFHALGWNLVESISAEAAGADAKGRAGQAASHATPVLQSNSKHKLWLVPDTGVRIPLRQVLPGETDHHEAETELLKEAGGLAVSVDRPLILQIGKGGNLGEKEESQVGWVLELSQLAGLAFSRQLALRIKQVVAGEATESQQARALKTLYLDRAPFFVGMFQSHGLTFFDPAEGNEAAYLSTEGVFRGWQLRATAEDYLLHLPPQGVGEAMEKGRKNEGYADIEEGETVDFRFPPISTLTVKSSDWERKNGPAPWNLRLTLNSLKDTRQVGLPLRAAEFEMLYGLRMKIEDFENRHNLRVAEVLARLGLPRQPMLATPLNGEYQPLSEDEGRGQESPSLQVYEAVRANWMRMLEVINSRLAVYEVFDERQVEFDPKGEPVGLTLHGTKEDPVLKAELRKAARLRVSMPAETNSSPGTDQSSPPLSNAQPLKLLSGKTLDRQINTPTPDWWASVIPNYDDGLAGSFAWAFESRVLYESLWASDPNPNTYAVVEAVEATLARLYFSALGGWSTQRAAFANGKIIVAVNVEMGRVSELRVEVIGRIGVLWNKAKLVTVFRRSVLPSEQFYDQQDLHVGRPLLRKVEEYVEFLEKYRLANDATTLSEARAAHLTEDMVLAKNGCLKASSCEERILVDSRWGTDVYDDKGQAMGFRVPLRKPGVSKRIYGPAGLLLHFHADEAGASSEVTGRIENLEAVTFWTDVRLDKTADTNAWSAIELIDVFPASSHDTVNTAGDDQWGDETKMKQWRDEMQWGTPPLTGQSAGCTFRVTGMDREASLNRHLMEPGLPEDMARPVGAVLRNITLSRGRIEGPMANAIESATLEVAAAGEHVSAFLEQMSSRAGQAGEQLFGWVVEAKKDIVGLTDAAQEKIFADLQPLMAARARVEGQYEAFMQRADKEVSHFVGSTTDMFDRLRGEATKVFEEPRGKIAATLRTFRKDELEARLDSYKDKLTQELSGPFAKAAAAIKKLKAQVEALTTLLDAPWCQALCGNKAQELKELQSTINAATAAVVERGVKDAATAATHLKGVIKTELGLRLTRRLGEEAEKILKLYLATVDSTQPANDAQAIDTQFAAAKTAVEKLLTGVVANAADMADKVTSEWRALVFATNGDLLELNKRAKQSHLFLERSAEVVADGIKNAFNDAASKLDGVRKNVDAVAGVVKDRVEGMEALLQNAARLHPDLVQRLKRDLESWVYAGSELAEWKDALKAHCQAQIGRLDGLFGEFEDQLSKNSEMLGRLGDLAKKETDQALKKALGDAKDLLTKNEARAKAWVQGAVDTQSRAWKEIKKQMEKATTSPLGKVVTQLGKVQARLGGLDPNELLGRLEKRFRENVVSVQKRIEREISGVGEQISARLDSLKVSLEKDTATVAKVTEQWNSWYEKTLSRSLANITGTIEHARDAVAQARERWVVSAQDALKRLEAGFGALEDAEKAFWRRKLQPELQQLLEAAHRIAALTQLPVLKGLPAKRSIDDLVQMLEGSTAEVGTLIASLKTQLGDVEKEIAALQDVVKTKANGIVDKFNKDLKALAGGTKQDAQALMAALRGQCVDRFRDYGAALAGELVPADWATNMWKDVLLSTGGAIADRMLKGLGLDKVGDLAQNPQAALEMLTRQLPGISEIERGMGAVQGWVDQQRETLALAMEQVRGVVDVQRNLKEGAQAAMETFRAFGQVPKVPALNFTDMASLGSLKQFDADVRGYVDNLNSRFSQVSYAFNNAAATVAEKLRMTPVKSLMDRAKNAGGAVMEELRLKAATAETVVRNLGQKIEADAQRLLKDIKPSLQDLLPDFGGLKLEKLLAASGLSEKFINDFKQKLETKHGWDPHTQTGVVDSTLKEMLLDDSLTVFSFGAMGLRLRNVRLSAHLRIQAGATGQVKRESDGRLVADWEVLLGGSPVITYEQAELENKDGHTRMQLDPKKVRLPSAMQTISDCMKSYSTKEGSGLTAGVINHLPTEVRGYVKYALDIPSVGAGTSGIQNLRIALFFELALLFPRFPSLHDASLVISAGVGLSDRKAPFIIAIWILGGCGWFQLRFDYVVPFRDGKPALEVDLSFAVGVSASLAFDVGFASGSVYVSLAVEIECHISSVAGHGRTRFSMVLTMAGNLSILGIITVSLIIVLSIGYESPGPMIGTGTISVKIKICWCFTLKVNRSFTKTFGGGGGGQAGVPVHGAAPRLAETSPTRVPAPVFPARRAAGPEPEPELVVPPPPRPAHVHRRAGRTIV